MTDQAILLLDTNTEKDIKSLRGTVTGWLVLDAVAMMKGDVLGYAEFIPDTRENRGRCPYELGAGGMVQFHIDMRILDGDVSSADVRIIE